MLVLCPQTLNVFKYGKGRKWGPIENQRHVRNRKDTFHIYLETLRLRRVMIKTFVKTVMIAFSRSELNLLGFSFRLCSAECLTYTF